MDRLSCTFSALNLRKRYLIRHRTMVAHAYADQTQFVGTINEVKSCCEHGSSSRAPTTRLVNILALRTSVMLRSLRPRAHANRISEKDNSSLESRFDRLEICGHKPGLWKATMVEAKARPFP